MNKTQEEIIAEIAQDAYDISIAILPSYPGSLSETMAHQALKQFRRELVRESIQKFIRLSKENAPAPKTGPTPRRNPSYETNYNENYTRRNRGEEVESVHSAEEKYIDAPRKTVSYEEYVSRLTEEQRQDLKKACAEERAESIIPAAKTSIDATSENNGTYFMSGHHLTDAQIEEVCKTLGCSPEDPKCTSFAREISAKVLSLIPAEEKSIDAPSERVSHLGKPIWQRVAEIESTPEGKALMEESRRETDMEVRIAELEEEVAKWKNQAEVCEAALETLSREEIAASRMYELEEQGVALICGTEAAERQYSRIRKMTDEEFAEYKRELMAVRALIPADKNAAGMAFNGHEWYPADEKSKPGSAK